jgi:sigma54-dependent transcription regulator
VGGARETRSVGATRTRERKSVANDADRLRKYLGRFDLEWGALKARLART